MILASARTLFRALAPLALCLLAACVVRNSPDAGMPKTILQVDKDNYAAQVLNHQGACLVLFYDTGSDSTEMHRRFIFFGDKFGDHVKFCRFKWSKGMDGKPYGLEATPTVILYRNGAEIDRLKGNPPRTKDFINWDEDFELWILRMAMRLESDQQTATYECYFKNGYELQFSNH
jgi:hypothetical protein